MLSACGKGKLYEEQEPESLLGLKFDEKIISPPLSFCVTRYTYYRSGYKRNGIINAPTRICTVVI